MIEKIIFADQITDTITYITSPEGIAAIEITSNPGGREWYWVFTDHTSATLSAGLGSISTMLRESDGQKFEMSFDTCSVKPDFCECSEAKSLVEPIPAEERGREGNRRNPDIWENYTTSFPDFAIDRGFTGHVQQPFGLLFSANQLRLPIPQRNDCGKHLYAFNLINMLSKAKSLSEAYTGNGRVGVYPERQSRFGNPIIGRMLSPDLFIQAPGYSQSLNRYSYCWNNPLKYTDPTGYELGVENRNNWFWWEYRGGSNSSHGIGPGSNNHWSDSHRDKEGDYMLMNSTAYNNKRGSGAWQSAYANNLIQRNSISLTWNPVAGNEVYQETYIKNKVRYVNIYYEGVWVNAGINAANSGGDGVTGQDMLGLLMQTGNFISSASDDARAFANGKYVHGNGKVYSQKFFGNQYVSKYSVSASKATSLKYAKAIGRVSTGLTVIGGVVTVADGLFGEDGWQNHHYADLAISAAIYGTAAAIPVAGWIVGGLYFVGDMTSQYYTGKSLTENLFD